MTNSEVKTVYCKTCNKDVIPVVRVFNTRVCPKCSIIVSSDMGIDKVGR